MSSTAPDRPGRPHKNVRGALDDFYSSLSEEQKAQFNLIGRQQTAKQS